MKIDRPHACDYSKSDYSLAIALFVVAFMTSFIVELQFYILGVFDQWDTLFDADPVAALSNFANGWGGGPSGGFSHPNIAHFFSPLIRGGVKIFGLFVPGIDVEHARKLSALLVLPLASGLQFSLIFLICRRLGLITIHAGLLSGIGLVSFGWLIFGAVPDSFALSSLAITLGIFLMVSDYARKFPKREALWGAVGIFATGITITNVITISILQFGSYLQSGMNFKAAAWRTSITAVLVVIGTLMIALVGYHAYGRQPKELFVGAARGEGMRSDLLDRAAKYPVALADTLVAPMPVLIDNEPAIRNNHKFKRCFSLGKGSEFSTLGRGLSLLLVALVGMGGVAMLRGTPRDRAVGAALWGILLFNGVFHSFWGTGLFLYSGHWFVPELLLLSGCFLIPGVSARTKATVGLGAFALLAINNFKIMHFIFATLHAMPAPVPG
jgi:hypothetical protein